MAQIQFAVVLNKRKISGTVIWLKGSYSYGGDTHYPAENQYSIFQKDGNTYVSYNSTEDSGYHDILVKGADPHGDIQFW